MTTAGKESNSPKTGPIAIVGMGGIFPEAANLQAFWDNILSKKDCIRELPDFYDFDGFYGKDDYHDPDPRARDKTYARRAGYLPEVQFDPMEFGIPPAALESISQLQLMALPVARDALRDAGLLEKGKNSVLRRRTGVILGVAGFGDTAFQLASRLDYPNWRRVLENSGIREPKVSEIVERLRALYIEWDEDSFPGFLGNVVAGRIANRFDLGGINCTVDAACAGSLAAIKMAMSELLEGSCDAVLTGGVQVENDVMSLMCFSKTPALSIEGVCRPFDADSDGMLIGAGIGMMALKRLEDAERDGDGIYAVIRGIGSASDGRTTSIYAPHTSGQLAALRNCYEKAGLSPGDIQLLEGHGTGTRAGDACEIATILEFFAGVAPRSIALGSVKSQIGHLRAAAGAASAIKVALALHNRVLPPTLHIRNPNPGLASGDSPFYLNSEPKPWPSPEGRSPRRGAVSSFGFGGANFHIILEEYTGRESAASGVREAMARGPDSGRRPLPDAGPGVQNEKKRLKVAINGFRYLDPSTRARRDRALHGKSFPGGPNPPAAGVSSDVFAASGSPRREMMEKSGQRREDDKPQPHAQAMEMNKMISDRLERQESLDRLQSQFHENQAGYIELLSRYMERQYALIEKVPPGPHLDKILDNFAAVVELLDKNQQRYHDNHDRYLQNQLNLLNARSLPAGEPAPAPTPRTGRPDFNVLNDPPASWRSSEGSAVSTEGNARPSEPELIPLRSTTRDDSRDADVNPYASQGRILPSSPTPVPDREASAPPRSGYAPEPSPSGPVAGAPLSVDIERIVDKLRDIVADKTGYPKDMLEMDMDLETDMGVDSIKWLEIFAAMAEEFPDSPIEPESVGRLRTLGDIAAFIEDYLRNRSFAAAIGEAPVSTGAPALPAAASVVSSGSPETETATRPGSPDVSRMIDRLRVMIIEKNGYLPEMLTEDSDLDSVGLDLVDWIDIIAAMQEEFPDVKVDLREMEQLNTLGEIEGYLCGNLAAEVPGGVGASSAAPAVGVAGPASPASGSVSDSGEKPDNPDPVSNSGPGPAASATLSSPFQVVISTAAVEVGGPEPAEEADDPAPSAPPSGIRVRSVEKKELSEPDRILSIPAENSLWVVMDEGEGVGGKLAEELRDRGARAVLLAFPDSLVRYGGQAAGTLDRFALPGCDEKHCKATLAEIREKHGPVSGFVYIHPFRNSGAASIGDLFREEDDLAARLAFRIAKHLRQSMPPKPDPGDRLSFVAVARMDGELGTGERTPFSIFGGCLSGLVQSLGREWPDVFCRFLDIAPELPAAEAAASIRKELADLEADLGEVGYDAHGKRCTLEIVEEAADAGRPGFVPDENTVFVVSGGGRGITAECVVEMARVFRGKYILVGRAPAAEDEPEWARDCPDEASLKQRIISRLADRQQRVAPVEVDKMLRPVLAGREVRRTIERIERNGAEAIYCRADITDGDELREAIEKGRSRFGEIDALIHGAGDLADKKIQNKTSKDFDRVFDCKVRGLRHLQACLDFDRLRSVALFSSVASLWGNAGQTDYAMANALLDKFARCCRILVPEKAVAAVHWGPWDHGMVTPSLKKLYRERNIELISRDEGSRMCVELFKSNAGPQPVLCGSIPVPPPRERQIRQNNQPVEVQRTLIPGANPFLQDHVIDGRPVLPATCAVHWMARTCEALLPGHVFRELREFKVLKGIVFQEESPGEYIAQVEPAATEPLETMAVKIFSRAEGQTVYHYSGEIVLSPYAATPGPMPVYEEMDLTRDGRPPEEFYAGPPLFHGRSFQGVKQVCNIGSRHITVHCCLPPPAESMQGQFRASSWNPYVTDVQLQSILPWARDFLKAGCLPASIGRIEQFRPVGFGEDFYVSTRIKSRAEYRLVVDMTVHDAEGKVHMRWADVQLTVSERLHEQFRRNRPENRP